MTRLKVIIQCQSGFVGYYQQESDCPESLDPKFAALKEEPFCSATALLLSSPCKNFILLFVICIYFLLLLFLI
jgi:hypothetical protein